MGVVNETFPTSLPAIEQKPAPLSQAEISRFATTFHVPGQPIVNSAVDGPYYMWSEGGLIVGPNTQHVDFSTTAPVDAPIQTSDGEFTALSQQLASSVVSYYPVKLTSISYYAPRGTDLNFVSRDQATAIQLTYLPTFGGLPLVAGDPKSSESVVRYNAAKTLLYYSGYVYPQFVQTGKTSPIISLQDAQARLLAGKGSILSASSRADINAHDTRWYQFSLATITKAALAYYYDFANKRLSPVFLFTGTTIDTATQNQVDTVSAVSAVP